MAIPGKNSFLLYHDQRVVFDLLSDEQAGRLIKIIFEYSEDGTVQEVNDPMLKVALPPIIAAMNRACEKYKAVVQRNKENGAKGGRPSKKPSGLSKNPVGYSGNPKKPTGNPKKPDSDRERDPEPESEREF